MSDPAGPPVPPSPAGAPGAPPAGRAPLSRMRVGVGLLLAVIACLVILLDALVGGRPALHHSAPGTGPLVALLSAAALHEFYGMLAHAGIPSHAAYGSLASLVILSLRALLPACGVPPGAAEAFGRVALLLAILLPAAARMGFRSGEPGAGGSGGEPGARPGDLRVLAGTALGLLFVHVPMALLLELRLVADVAGMSGPVPAGLVLATMTVLGCKVGDSTAYFVGRTVGRRPLCWVSPRKTWEGAVAGALAGTVAAALPGTLFGLPLRDGLAFGLVVNLAGQGGDLAESWLKRCCGVKDSGRTFGEMGGALDLVDALLLAGPAAYLFHRVVLA